MTYCCLATGLADYTMLRRTLTAGAWTLMGKPFQIAHLQSILKTASTMIAARNLAETMVEALPQGVLTIDRRGDTPVNSEDLARAIRFALGCGADKDTAMRRLPIVVHELLSNARQYGAAESSEQWYRLRLENQGANMRIRVSDTGRGFGWARELIRARTTWDRVKASGLQLASALCEELTFSDGEFSAAALISKVSPYEQYMAAMVSKAHQ
jgi:anti-sigma regulatory factor (Ser/Thr protein kinase)